MQLHILLVSCDDQKGLISRLSSILLKNDLNIIVMREFVEKQRDRFFARLELTGEMDIQKVLSELRMALPENAHIEINPKKEKDIILLATKEHHCLGDLLIKHHYEELKANIRCVIANYDDLRGLTEKFGVPFYHVSHTEKSKEEFEKEIMEIVSGFRPDYLVLCKFMRILSPEFVSRFENRIINIHHSFLPAFIGANPYKRAFERGVKLIGATAHFVNGNLDEGPIITQRTIPVDHSFSVQDMRQAGREIEKSVLSSAVRSVFEDRVFVSGNKTIILEG